MKKELAFISNLILIAFEITGIVFCFIEKGEIQLEYYTNIANLFSLFACVNYLLAFFYKEKRFKKATNYMKLITVSALASTFVTVLLIVAPESSEGYSYYLFHGSFLWFHFLAPIIAIISFIFFEQYEFKYLKDSLIALIFTFVYAVSMYITIELYGKSKVPFYVLDSFNHIQRGLLILFLAFDINFILIALNKLAKWKKHLRFQSTIYYKDELNDDFGGEIKIRPLPKNYKYESTGIWKLFDFILYWIIAKPFAFIYMKIKFHQRIVNRKAVKEIKGGYFIYSNHTLFAGDAFTPSLIDSFKKNYLIVSPETGSLTALLPILRGVGALPIDNDVNQMKKLIRCINDRSKKSIVSIYPEAHIWPYYTKIRPFKDISFKYPVRQNKPVVVVTNTYRKGWFAKRPRIVTFVDGPFYPKEEYSNQENIKYLRDITYKTMTKRIEENSTYSYFDYQKIPESDVVIDDD